MLVIFTALCLYLHFNSLPLLPILSMRYHRVDGKKQIIIQSVFGGFGLVSWLQDFSHSTISLLIKFFFSLVRILRGRIGMVDWFGRKVREVLTMYSTCTRVLGPLLPEFQLWHDPRFRHGSYGGNYTDYKYTQVRSLSQASRLVSFRITTYTARVNTK